MPSPMATARTHRPGSVSNSTMRVHRAEPEAAHVDAVGVLRPRRAGCREVVADLHGVVHDRREGVLAQRRALRLASLPRAVVVLRAREDGGPSRPRPGPVPRAGTRIGRRRGGSRGAFRRRGGRRRGGERRLGLEDRGDGGGDRRLVLRHRHERRARPRGGHHERPGQEGGHELLGGRGHGAENAGSAQDLRELDARHSAGVPSGGSATAGAARATCA